MSFSPCVYNHKKHVVNRIVAYYMNMATSSCDVYILLYVYAAAYFMCGDA